MNNGNHGLHILLVYRGSLTIPSFMDIRMVTNIRSQELQFITHRPTLVEVGMNSLLVLLRDTSLQQNQHSFGYLKQTLTS